MLTWLDSDREVAGRKYEEIRTRLVKLYNCRGCAEADSLADQTIDRVVKKLPQIIPTYEGNPASYFYGFVDNIHHEYRRGKTVQMPETISLPARDWEEVAEQEEEYDCLTRCMDNLPRKDHDLILQYYRDERKAKIDHRKELAARLGIGLNALRIKAYRIRAILYECVQKCLNAAPSERIQAK